MKFMYLIFPLLILLMCCKPVESNTGNCIPDVFNQYTSSVIERDINKMMTTLTDDSTFHFLTTQGELITSRNEYRAFHEAWFSEDGWEISFGQPLIRQNRTAGYVISEFHYIHHLSEYQVMQLSSWVTLILQPEKNRWKIVADITTPIKREIIETTH